jgi:hypothetical protein
MSRFQASNPSQYGAKLDADQVSSLIDAGAGLVSAVSNVIPSKKKPAKKKKASSKKKSKKKGAKTSREEAELEDDFDEARWLEQQMELTRRMNTMYCANSDTGGGCDADQEEEEDDEDEEEDPLEYFDHDAAAEQEAARKANSYEFRRVRK